MSDRAWTIFLEIEPVAKGRPRFGRGRAFTPEKTRHFEQMVRELIRKQYYHQPIQGPVHLDLVFVFNRPTKPKHDHWHMVRPDLDNLIKAITDAANGLLWEDDSQIAELTASKKYSKPGLSPRILLSFRSIDAVL